MIGTAEENLLWVRIAAAVDVLIAQVGGLGKISPTQRRSVLGVSRANQDGRIRYLRRHRDKIRRILLVVVIGVDARGEANFFEIVDAADLLGSRLRFSQGWQ